MTELKAWVLLTFAILGEVAATTFMKLSHGFTELKPSIGIFVCYAFSFAFLTLSLKKLEMGFAYALWSGLGTLLIFLVGVYYFNEPITMLKTVSVLAIIVGVIGLKQA